MEQVVKDRLVELCTKVQTEQPTTADFHWSVEIPTGLIHNQIEETSCEGDLTLTMIEDMVGHIQLECSAGCDEEKMGITIIHEDIGLKSTFWLDESRKEN